MSIDTIQPQAIETLYHVTDPNIAERIILDFAILLQARRDGKPAAVVSWEMQVIAASFYEQFGLEETLTELAKEI